MDNVQATKTVYSVSQFLDWQRSGTLDLNPIFQRRTVWKSLAKSQLIDSVVRGYPIPIILLRQVQDLNSLSIKMEVVDGQQRLRTFLSYIDHDVLNDYDEEKDYFTVRKIHNAELAGKSFLKIPSELKQALLSYELSTHVLPATTSDEMVFRIFARLNSTGLSLKPQEVRNSEYHGHFKTLVYNLSFQCLDYWRKWKIFSDDSISRMDEAEAVSEYLIAMMRGVEAKDQRKIKNVYSEYEENLDGMNIIKKRFDYTMSTIDRELGDALPDTAFRRPALFYSLFTAIYDHLYGLKSNFGSTKPRELPKGLSKRLIEASNRIRGQRLSEKVQDAMDRATADRARRLTRHKFILEALNLEPAS